MSRVGSYVASLPDPRLARYVAIAYPAWLWRADGTALSWGNAAAASALGAPTQAALRQMQFDPRAVPGKQILQLGETLPESHARLERLRGLGRGVASVIVCSCQRFRLSDGTETILVVGSQPLARGLPQADRLRRELEDAPPLFAIDTDGGVLFATEAAISRCGAAATVRDLGLERARLQPGDLIQDASARDYRVEKVGPESDPVLLLILAPERTDLKPPLSAVEQSGIALLCHGDRGHGDAVEAKAELHPQGPLRFLWVLDRAGRFAIESAPFLDRAGPRTRALMGEPWVNISRALGIDPEGQIERAMSGRVTFSGIRVSWPGVGPRDRLLVELSGLPVLNRGRELQGYRGFGVCRDFAPPLEVVSGGRTGAGTFMADTTGPEDPPSMGKDHDKSGLPANEGEGRPSLAVVPSIPNVLPFRGAAGEQRRPALTPVERNAFQEIAQALRNPEGPRAERASDGDFNVPQSAEETAAAVRQELTGARQNGAARRAGAVSPAAAVLDELPVGVLVHSDTVPLFANKRLLAWTGSSDWQSAAAVLLGSLGGRTGADDKTLQLRIRDTESLDLAVTHSPVTWDGEAASLLTFSPVSPSVNADSLSRALKLAEDELAELRAVLEVATDAVVLVDASGTISALNPSAEHLFGREHGPLQGRPFLELIDPESHAVALDHFEGLRNHGVASILREGRELRARTKAGEERLLFMRMGRIGAADRYCIAFRDVTRWKTAELESQASAHRAEQASALKSDFLGKVGHEVRTPLNAIIGFAEIMIQEQLGPVSNERYREYLKDIHSSGLYLLSLIDDLLDLSKIEAGKVDLQFASVDLNELVGHCVALMQPEANGARIIIRSAMTSSLPPVVADARSLKQITFNLLSNSIKFTNPGGQVIVSTALGDAGDVILRIRDTGIGMSESELDVALQPFGQVARGARGSGLGLPLAKALTEANRASFSIRSAPSSGTLVEVTFPSTRVLAE